MDFANAARTRLHMVSASNPTGRTPGVMAGGLAASAVESVMASVQLSH